MLCLQWFFSSVGNNCFLGGGGIFRLTDWAETMESGSWFLKNTNLGFYLQNSIFAVWLIISQISLIFLKLRDETSVTTQKPPRLSSFLSRPFLDIKQQILSLQKCDGECWGWIYNVICPSTESLKMSPKGKHDIHKQNWEIIYQD